MQCGIVCLQIAIRDVSLWVVVLFDGAVCTMGRPGLLLGRDWDSAVCPCRDCLVLMHVFVMSWYSYATESFLTVVGLPRFLTRQQGLLCLGALVWRERERGARVVMRACGVGLAMEIAQASTRPCTFHSCGDYVMLLLLSTKSRVDNGGGQTRQCCFLFRLYFCVCFDPAALGPPTTIHL